MKKLLVGLLVVLLVVLAITFTGCSIRGSSVDASKFSNKVTYFQCNKTGEVFSVIASRKAGNASQTGLGMAHIDRADVTKAIKRQIKGFKDFSNF